MITREGAPQRCGAPSFCAVEWEDGEQKAAPAVQIG